MNFLSKIILFAPLTSLVTASPTAKPRSALIDTGSHCGQYDVVAASPYSLLLNQWGLAGATSGTQCANLVSQSGNTLAWTTTWTWSGGTGVKSFTNIQQNNNLNKQLSAISSIQSTWNWNQSYSGTVVADVAYDMFTSASSGGFAAHEIMIWLANYNAGPLSYTYSSSGQPVPIASNLSIAGKTWNLYNGSNGANQVWSFLATTGTYNNFSGDVNLFLKYLTSNSHIPTSQYLTTAQGGTEATSGSATLTTSAYSLVIA